MIPKIIHYCWFGRARTSELNQRCLKSWRRILPNYQIKEWNEENSPLENLYCREAYRRGLWSKLSNHVRLHALYNDGGVYLDTDVEVLKDFEPLLSNKCFLGFQQSISDTDWVNGAVLGSQARHPFIKRCLDMTEERYAQQGEFVRCPSTITTILTSMGLTEYRLQELEDVKIYPAEYFYPYPWFSKFSPDCITANTFCIHHWEGSWRKRPDLLPRPLLSRLILALRGHMYKTSKRVLWEREEQVRFKLHGQ